VGPDATRQGPLPIFDVRDFGVTLFGRQSELHLACKEGGKNMANAQTAPTARAWTNVPAADVAALRAGLRGATIAPDEPGYDETRKIWNTMIDRKPGLIARVSGSADVVQCVNFARDHKIPLAIRGAGHNIAGSALCDDGLVIDFSLLRSVRVDPKARTVFVQPGATLGDLDHETLSFGLSVPVGINSTTGVAGLALGGGFGWTSRKFGLTSDHLVGADVVTSSGERVHASEQENADLFWGLRGGGGNFGVVTSFEFRADPISPAVLAGLIVYPHAGGKAVLQRYREFTAKAPDELSVWVVLRMAPPLPFLPSDVHGKPVLVIALCYTGAPKDGERAIAPLRGLGSPVGEHVGPMPFSAWQQAFDPLLTPGARNYWKSHYFSDLADGLLDAALEYAARPPAPESEILLVHLGGQVNRIAPEATAFAHRDFNYIMNVHGRWSRAAEDERGIEWSRGLFRAAAPFSTGGVYVNFLSQDEADRVRGAYGSNYDRMVRLKQRMDPTNLFRSNQNVKPTA
jgi:FAD/FMN-containing dehydrogenase